jgi:ubiquinone/menaquinone biosynthesis C-methylase UbiE
MPEWNEKRRNIRHYDQQAQVYDSRYMEEQNAKIENALSGMRLKSDGLVLDMGCGTGFLLHHINKSTKLIVGLDISSKLLQEAKKHTKNLSNVLLVRADADNTPFPDRLFDKAFAVTLLQNMPDFTTTILEMKRISKPETVFVVTGLKKKFTQESFLDLLEQAQLKVSTMMTKEHLKDYVAICTNV